MGTPTLVIEILSKNTRSKDMIEKLNTYCLSDVEEYWIVDPRQQQVILYHFHDTNIQSMNTYKISEQLKSQVFHGLTLDVEALFSNLI